MNCWYCDGICELGVDFFGSKVIRAKYSLSTRLGDFGTSGDFQGKKRAFAASTARSTIGSCEISIQPLFQSTLG